MDIPLADSFDVPDDHLERVEIQGGDSVECDVEKDKGPLEEGVGRVGCWAQRSVVVPISLLGPP